VNASRDILPDATARIVSSCSSTDSINSEAIQHQKDLHGRVPDSFVPIDECVALDECKSERTGLVHHSGIQIFTGDVAIG
jgi:hypothetical protein